MINVEHFLVDRFPSLSQSPLFFKGISKLLKRLFHESEFQQFEKKYPHLLGLDFVDQALRHFGFSYSVYHTEQERIPKLGRVIVIANHPIGSLDGLALLDLVGKVRKDVKVVANDMLGAIKPLSSLLLAVDNMGGKTAKQNIRDIHSHLNAEGAIIIFPAGSVSRLAMTGIKDGDWNAGFLKIAIKTQSPILPIHVGGRNSAWFYSVSFFAKPLSTIFLVDEMFKQENKSISFRIGNPIQHKDYKQIGGNSSEIVHLFKEHIYKLPNKDSGIFNDVTAIAHPEDRQHLLDELKLCECLGETSDGKVIYLYHFFPNSAIMKEIGRLRELSFRMVGEGTGKRRDVDQFDVSYDHIMLWDKHDLEIVGSYRVVKTKEMDEQTCQELLYSSRIFEYKEPMNDIFKQGLELGRSFVQPRYWGKRSLDYLWFGIGAYIQKHPDIRFLFGAVSISNDYSVAAKSSLVYVYSKHFLSSLQYAEARIRFNRLEKTDVPLELFSSDNYKKDFSALKSFLANQNLVVPTMYKQYFNVCEEGGVCVVDFSIDPDFSHCVDGLVIADLSKLKKNKKARYMPESSAAKNTRNDNEKFLDDESILSAYSLGHSLNNAFASNYN